MDCADVFSKIEDFLIGYVRESGAKGFVVGVSGGVDSAVVAVLCKKTDLPTYALIMPTTGSNPRNIDDALRFCSDFKIDYEIINIQPVLDGFKSAVSDISGLREANLTARIRMSLLYDRSAKLNSLVVGTSNKSERMLGYGTIYGDTACALNPIGDLFKTEIFALANFLGISENIVHKAPSADFWEGQSDEADLGYSYEKIDVALRAIERGESLDGFDAELVKTVQKRIKNNAFKLNLPPIARLNKETL
jgi:NH(3)-dependent NAD(+) synthetase